MKSREPAEGGLLDRDHTSHGNAITLRPALAAPAQARPRLQPHDPPA